MGELKRHTCKSLTSVGKAYILGPLYFLARFKMQKLVEPQCTYCASFSYNIHAHPNTIGNSATKFWLHNFRDSQAHRQKLPTPDISKDGLHKMQ